MSLILLHCFQILWAVCASIGGLINQIFVGNVLTKVFNDHNKLNGGSYDDSGG